MAGELLVIAGLGIPVAAKIIPDLPMPGLPGRVWLNINLLGHHLPQMYADEEIHDVLTKANAASWGLCAACMGFGTNAELPDLYWPTGVDEIPEPCAGCHGTGRPCFIVTVTVGEHVTEAAVGILPHEYVKSQPLPGITGLCLGCGEMPDNKNHRLPATRGG
jgi:hypothetical protein